jgi:hypothetical protein
MGPRHSSREPLGLQLISRPVSRHLTLHKLKTVVDSVKRAMPSNLAFSKQVSMLLIHPSLTTSNQLGNRTQIFSSKLLVRHQTPCHQQPLKLGTQVHQVVAFRVTYGIS